MYKVTHAFNNSIIYFVGTKEECTRWMGVHFFEHSLMALVPIIRRRPHRYGFDALSDEQQVSYVIENWDNEIWTPVNVEIEYGMSIDSCEYRDDYFIPQILEEVRGTEYEKYIPEIVRGYLYFEFGF